MDDVIKKLVEIDRECAKKVEAAKEKKLDAQANMNSKKTEIYDEFIASQQDKIDQHKSELLSKNEENTKQLETEYSETLDKMEKLYNQNKDKWIDEIVDRCLK